MVKQLATENMPGAKACGICLMAGHTTDVCPTLQEDESAQQANTMGNYQAQPQRKYDPFSNTYNQGWMDNPNLSYEGARPQAQGFYPIKQQFQPAQPQY